MYNVAIVGGGPAGIFTALEITKLKPDWKVLLIEKGSKINVNDQSFNIDMKNCISSNNLSILGKIK